jgi:hypothetical protein
MASIASGGGGSGVVDVHPERDLLDSGKAAKLERGLAMRVKNKPSSRSKLIFFMGIFYRVYGW